MKVVVAGDMSQPVLLSTDKATAILIETNDGLPTVIFKLLSDGKGWLRYTKGEDKNFDEVAKSLGLI